MLISFSLFRASWPLLLLWAGSFPVVSAAPVAVNCSVDGQSVTSTGYRPEGSSPTQWSESASCQLNDPSGALAQASASVAFSLEESLGSGTITTSLDGVVRAGFIPLPNGDFTSVRSGLSISFQESLAVRSLESGMGKINVNWDAYPPGDFGDAGSASLSITGHSTSPNSPLGSYGDIFCYGSNCSYAGRWATGNLIDIDLSGPIVFTMSGMAGGNATGQGNPGGIARTTMHYNFQLFEADGVTPVSVTVMPEPATYGFCGLALAAYWAYRKRSQCC